MYSARSLYIYFASENPVEENAKCEQDRRPPPRFEECASDTCSDDISL